MTEVINLFDAPPMIWVCDCGCSTFNLLSNGDAECSFCGSAVDGAEPGWQAKTENAGERPDAGEYFSDTQANGNVDFAIALARKQAADSDVRLIITSNEVGAVRLWAAAETHDEIDWTLEKIDVAREMMAKRRPAND